MQTSLSVIDTMTDNIRGNRGWDLIKNLIVDERQAVARDLGKNAGSNTNRVCQYTIGEWVDNSWIVWGWGRDGATNKAFLKFDIATDDWVTPANHSGACGGSQLPILFWFDGAVYGFTDANVAKHVPATSFSGSFHTGGYVVGSAWQSVAEPIKIGTRSYWAFDNKVYEMSAGGTALTLKFTLNEDTYITSLTSVGLSLSVMTYSLSDQSSREFLFNVSDLSIGYYDAIDWGFGRVVTHKESRGIVLGVQDGFSNSSGDSNEAFITLKRRSGGNIVRDAKIRLPSQVSPWTFLGSTAYNYIGGIPAKMYEDKLCFKTKYTRHDGEVISGIMSYSRDGNWKVETTNEFDSNNYPNLGFIRFNNSWLIAHSSTSTTIDTFVYAPFSGSTGAVYYDGVLITRAIDHGIPEVKKEVKGVRVFFKKLTSGQSVSLYYRVVGESGWTLIQTESTVGARKMTVANTAKIPNYNEIQYKVVMGNRATFYHFEETSLPTDDSSYERE